MSKVDDIVAARKAMPKLPVLTLANGTWVFEVSESGVLDCQRADGWIDREQVRALIAWLVENYGEGKA